MITVEEAIDLINAQEAEKKEIEINIDCSLGHVLTKDIQSGHNIPSFRQSAMDGYAVVGKSKSFFLKGESKAGKYEHISLTEGDCIRIFTGAKVPDEAIAVIMQEKTKRSDNEVFILDEIEENKNIRPVGEQLKKGDVVFRKGHKLNPASISLLQHLSVKKVSVFNKPKIALLITGDELKSSAEQLNDGEIFESNSIMLKMAAQQFGFQVHQTYFVKDDFDSTKNTISEALEKFDVVLISGGISVGDYDFVYDSLKENQVKEVFYKVFQKPGKPLFFGKKATKFVFALPGNPAASLTCFYIYVLPLLKKISGIENYSLKKESKKITKYFSNKSKRALFLKGKIKGENVQILEGQSSAMLQSFAEANCLIYIPKEKTEVQINENVDVFIIP